MPAVAALVAVAVGCLLVPAADAVTGRERDVRPVGAARRGALAIARTSRAADAGGVRRRTPAAPHAPRAPSGSPLASPQDARGEGGEVVEAPGPQPGEVDPLVSNGLGSPLCKGALGGDELTAAKRRACETSGFIASAAPTGDFGIDVHIDTGFLGVTRGGLETIVQDLFITPVWMALVWAVHALIVMLEWGFTIDLLDSPALSSGIGTGLRRIQQAVTQPWLGLALSCASVLAVYNGLIRRRIAETVGQAALLLAMIACGLWVTVDPTGTVGVLGGWANEAGVGTLATVTEGAPTRAGGALADGMSRVFAAAVEVPWCYLEFGDVAWCRDPARLNPELHAAGLRIAAEESFAAKCASLHVSEPLCPASDSGRTHALEHSAQLLREARTNGAIFLALPANGPARNSINESSSLLRVMCRSSDATACHGPMASVAEFRTGGATWSRVGGLLLIAAGLVGMLLMLGFIAARLLAAALFSLLYLLVTPAAVLAPAFGERGREVFGRWATQLFVAVVSKLLFSFLLGLLLAVAAILADLEGLGFWTQWLLMSVFWWSSFLRRGRVLALGARGGNDRFARYRSFGRFGGARAGPRGALALARRAQRTLVPPAPSDYGRGHAAAVGRDRARTRMAEQVSRMLAGRARGARAGADTAEDRDELRARLASSRAQLERVHAARADALAAGNARRAVQLAHRAARVGSEIGEDERRLSDARALPRETAIAEQARFLDAQAALPASRDARSRRLSGGRDYRALAALAGYTRDGYEHLDPARQRAARLEVDRELAMRAQLRSAARDVAHAAERSSASHRDQRRVAASFDRALERRVRESGERMPRSQTAPGIERWSADGRARVSPRPVRSSPVMEDAREVARRRKRQLGFGRD
jgi:hypothetical protein